MQLASSKARIEHLSWSLMYLHNILNSSSKNLEFQLSECQIQFLIQNVNRVAEWDSEKSFWNPVGYRNVLGAYFGDLLAGISIIFKIWVFYKARLEGFEFFIRWPYAVFYKMQVVFYKSAHFMYLWGINSVFAKCALQLSKILK